MSKRAMRGGSAAGPASLRGSGHSEEAGPWLRRQWLGGVVLALINCSLTMKVARASGLG